MVREPQPNIRVVHLLKHLNASGMERMLESSFDVWLARGVDSFVVAQEPSPFVGRLAQVGYAVTLRRFSLRNPIGVLELAWRLRRIRPDVMHIHTEGQFGIAVLVTRVVSRRTTVVRTIHNTFPVVGRRSYSRRVQRLLVRGLVDAYAAPSDAVKKREELLGDHVATIWNWVDRRYTSWTATIANEREAAGIAAREAPVIVIVGNAGVAKNHEVALEAVRAGGFRLRMHGDMTQASPRVRELLEGIRDRGLMEYEGQSEPFESLQTSDVFFMPSLNEGMSVALAEAVAMGIPCVVSDVQGARWAQPFENVRLSPLNSDWNVELRRAMRELPDLRRNGDRDVSTLEVTRGVESYLALYGLHFVQPPLTH